MSAPTAAPPAAVGAAALDELAAATQRALGADAVVIAHASKTPSATGELLLDVAGVDGLSGRNVDDLRRGLTHLAGAVDLGGRGWLAIPFLAGTRIAGANIILSHGFASVLLAAVVSEGEQLGTIYAFKHAPTPFENEALIATFARQVAIALGSGRLGPPEPPRVAGANLAALDELALSAHDFGELSRAIQAAVAPLFGAEKCGVMVWDESREVLQMVTGSFGASQAVALSCQVKVLDPASNSARVFTTGRGYFCNEAREDPGIMQEYVHAFGIEKLLTTPLILGGRPIGVLHIANPESDFTVEDVRRAATLTPRVAGAVELARTLFRLRRQGRLEEILSGVAVAVASGESISAFLRPALKEVGRAVEATFLALVPDGGESLIWRHGATPLEAVVLDEVSRKPGMRAYVVGPEKAGDPGWAVFYAPINVAGQRAGTVAALRTRGEPFARDERRALVRLAGLAALSFATERYQQQRAELARLQERQRIADDLHDDVAQILFAAQLNLDGMLERTDEEDPHKAEVERVLGLLVRADMTIRKVISRLSNPVAPEFDQRLASVVAGVEQEFSVAIHMQLSPDATRAAESLRRSPADALIKVSREALVNAAKHAGPCRIRIILSITGRDRERLLVTVMDDGVGRSRRARADRGHGLAALRRALDAHDGCLRVGKAPGGGTKVTASVPLEPGLSPLPEAAPAR